MSSTINMLPAIQQLCQLEDTCPLPDVPSGQEIVSPNQFSQAAYTGNLGHTFATYDLITSQSFAINSLLPQDYENLVHKIKSIWHSHLFSKIYCERLIRPLYQRLTQTDGRTWFEEQLASIERKKALEAIIKSIIQNFSNPPEGAIQRGAIEAVQEVTNDLYQTFQQKKCQTDGTVTCKAIPSPLPYWSNTDLSTYPNTSAILGNLEGVGIVNVPKKYASRGVLAWGCLGHEVAGHDILDAYRGAQEELKVIITERMRSSDLEIIAPYWLLWLNEAASDVMGVLHMGPAGAFSLIGFLRAIHRNSDFKLSDVGYLDDPHPVDLIRGFVVQAAVDLLSRNQFTEASQYASLIKQELTKDLQGTSRIFVDLHPIETPEEGQFMSRVGNDLRSFSYNTSSLDQKLIGPLRSEFIKALRPAMPVIRHMRAEQIDVKIYSGIWLSLDLCQESARLFAEIVMYTPLRALGGKSFGMIRSWSNLDEKVCSVFRLLLPLEIGIVKTYEDTFASQVVAAAIMESISETHTERLNEARLQKIFQRMVSTLQMFHINNPEWKAILRLVKHHRQLPLPKGRGLKGN